MMVMKMKQNRQINGSKMIIMIVTPACAINALQLSRLFQDGLTGSAWGDWALYTDSPLRGSGCTFSCFRAMGL